MDNEQPTLTARVARLEETVWERNGIEGPPYAGNTIRGETSDARPTALEEIFNRIQLCSERVVKAAFNLEDIGTRIMGPLPEKDSGVNAAEPYPDGTLDQALRAIDRLDMRLARLEAASLRLERI